MSRVLTHIENGVAHVELNRPDKRNGLDFPMFEGIIEAGLALKTNTSVRAIVLSGKGKAFCAGLDFMAFMAAGPEALAKLDERPSDNPANVAQRVATVWGEIPVPVIAALHGSVFGGGLQIALGADIRIAAPDAQLSVMEIKWGLIPDMGITQTLPRLVRLDVAKELTFTGRVISGTEAAHYGLVTRTAEDPLAEALELARTIAGKSPHAIRSGKALLDRCVHMSAKEALLYETELQVALFQHPNQMEAVQANFAKRTPDFQDPEA